MKLLWVILFIVGAVPLIIIGYNYSIWGILGAFAGLSVAISVYGIERDRG